MKYFLPLSFIFIFALSFTVFGQSTLSSSSTDFQAYIFVNSNADSNDANTADNICADSAGRCTLRAAVQQANAKTDQYSIKFSLTAPVTIQLNLGQIRIENDIKIQGLGSRNLVINGGGKSRVFGIYGSTIPITAEFNGLTIAGGDSGTSGGGGIYNSPQCTLVLVDTTVRNNIGTGGGGIFNQGYLYITQTAINNNTSVNRSSGGGIFTTGQTNIVNTTITNNEAGYGGGIAVAGSDTTLVNNTIFNNTVTDAGGGIINYQSEVDVRNTIIAQNNSPSNPDVSGDTFNSFNSLGNNLIGTAEYASGFVNGENADKVGSNGSRIDPKLGALQNNGGNTDTRALLDGSPAIDSGNNCVRGSCPSNNAWTVPLIDQRGNAFGRFASTVDIGAYEKQLNCVYMLDTTSQDFPASGGSGVVTGTTGIGCALSLFTSSTFINSNFISGSGNLGSGILTFTVPFTVQANTGAPRTGTLLIGGQAFTVNQAGVKSRKRVRFF
jgi:hypothetical protein